MLPIRLVSWGIIVLGLVIALAATRILPEFRLIAVLLQAAAVIGMITGALRLRLERHST